MIDFASANATRHAMLMDPATQFEGGQPVSVDSLYGIISATLIPGVRPVFMDFGADGALYVGVYSGSYYRFVSSPNAMAIYRFAYIGGQDTPGPDPKAVVPETSSVVQFNIGKSGGVSYTWDFGDDSPDVTTTEPTVTHTYDSAGDKTATLTVHYADGDAASKTVTAEDVPTPLFTNVDEEVGATVPMVLALTLGSSASFGAFTPSVEKDYLASTTASALATSGSATLSISDPATATAGRLVNADFALPARLQAKASSTIGTGGPFADVGSAVSPTFGQLFMDNSQADPRDNSVTILPGETVTFSYAVGDGQNAHNVGFYTFSPSPSSCVQTAGTPIPGFPVPPLPAFSILAPWAGNCTFNNPGTYSFYCTVHGEMTGTVIVAAAQNQPPTVSASRSPRR